MAKDVLEDDDDKALDDKADRAAAEKVKERVEEKEQSEPDDPVEIDLDKADEEIEPLTADARESRQERRRNRYREIQDERTAALKRAEDAERREAETRNLFLQQLQQLPRPPQGPPQPDALDKELDDTLAEQRLVYRDFNARAQANAITEADEREFQQKVQVLQKRLLTLGGKLALRESGQQQNPEHVKREVIRQQMMQMHGDVLGNQATQMYCDGVYKQLRAMGRPDDWSTLEEAAEATRRNFGMPSRTRRPAPSEASKRKLTGMARGGGAPQNGDSPRVVTLSSQDKKMANALFKHIPSETERYKRWASGPGRRLLEKR